MRGPRPRRGIMKIRKINLRTSDLLQSICVPGESVRGNSKGGYLIDVSDCICDGERSAAIVRLACGEEIVVELFRPVKL